MKRVAHIEEGKVVNVSVWNKVPESLDLVEIPQGVPVGIEWDYIEGEFFDNRPTESE